MIDSLRTLVSQPWTHKRLWRAMIWNAVFLLLIPAAYAQTTSSISGTVLDSAGALVPGAKVTLTDEASKAIRVSTSNGQGFFDFVAVQPATYSVSIAKPGFEAWTVTGIEVHPGDSLTVPKIRLKIGEAVESVTVTADAAGVSLTSGEHSTLITSTDINRLSTTGRDALELVTMLPGFTLNAGTSLLNTGPDYTTTRFGSGGLGGLGAGGAAPQSGFVNVSSDGVNVMDPGDMGNTIANINMDQVQEVKVQTSNFGADEAKGPIVINAVGKSGGSSFHGSLYAYTRNYKFNSNDWLSNDTVLSTDPVSHKTTTVPKAETKYLYPGGSISGPIIIPGTKFNQSKRITFSANFEDYRQVSNVNGFNGGPTYAFIPTPTMLSGNLSAASIATALNVPAIGSDSLATGCTKPYTQTPDYSNIGGDCFPISGGTDENGNTVPGVGQTNEGQLSPSAINPAMATFTKFYPAINRTPQPVPGSYVSDGFNWVKDVMETDNGYQFHGRVDDNISDNLKLYVSYNLEKVNTEIPMQDLSYNPPSTIPYYAPLYSNSTSNWASIDLTKIVSATTTNELVISGVFYHQPMQFKDRSAVVDTNTPWQAAGYEGGALQTGTNQLPRIYTWEGIGIPNQAIGYVPAGGQGDYLRKSSADLKDDFTKTVRTHTLKAGVYAEQTRNNQDQLASDVNSTILFDRYNSCAINQKSPNWDLGGGAGKNQFEIINPPTEYMGNTVGNFLTGCPGGYNQSSSDPGVDMYYNTLEFFVNDEWKATSKLTVTLGLRFVHQTPWTDAHGIGAAVWDPTKYNPIQPGVFSPTMTFDPSTWPGISWHKENQSVPVVGMASRMFYYSPRFGVSYDLFGNGKTTLRGGWGAYQSHDNYNLAAGPVNTSDGVVDRGFVGPNSCTLDQLMNGAYPAIPTSQATVPTLTGKQVLGCGWYGNSVGIFASGSTVIPSGAGTSLYADDPKDSKQPVTYSYNFTVDQQLPRKVTFEVAYVGNQAQNLPRQSASSGVSMQNVNVIPLGAFFAPDPLTGQSNPATNISSGLADDYRPYPNYGNVNVTEHTNWASYNSMQVSLNKQSGAFVFGSNYTWSKALAVRGNWDTGNIGDPVNAHHDYGIVSYDRPQVFNFNFSYVEGKKFKGNRELGWILNTWEVSGITRIQSGPDLSVASVTNYGFGAQAGYVVSGAVPNLTTVSIPVSAASYLGSPDYNLQPLVTCDPRKGLKSSTSNGQVVRQYVNGNCFALPPLGTQGNWTLPDVHGPAFFSSDLSVYKDIQMTDRQALQFRMTGINFLNHPLSTFTNNDGNALNLTFADPACDTTTGAGCLYTQSAAIAGLALSNSGFGKTPFKTGARIVEFSLKYNF
ncbi:MAG: carboxypeptidase-like regulatory domain-containing protein [Terracidiphilus sp.]